MLEPIAALADLHTRYDALLCDIWGVVHNGRAPYPGAVPALVAARAAGLKVVLITNAPKPQALIPGQLDRLGVPRDAWDAIVTSGDAIRAELAARAPGPMLAIGEGGDDVLWRDLGMASADLTGASFLAVAGVENPFAADALDAYAPLLRAARARDLEMLCANPDIQVRIGDRLGWCAGALARAYADLGGRVVMAGKPHPPIYARAYQALAGVDRSRMLAIGDGVVTDVLGANAEGLDCLFIAGGLLGEGLLSGGALDLAKARAALADAGAQARYVMAALA